MTLDATATLRFAGIVTEPNEFGVYPPGACKAADNVLFRLPNKAESARSYANQVEYGAGGSATRYVQSLDNGHWLALQQAPGNYWSLWVDSIAGTGIIDTNSAFDAAYCSGFNALNHAFVASNTGVYVLDTLKPSTPTDRTFRPAGMPQPMISQMGLSVTDAAAIPASTGVAYCACFRREQGEYAIVSVPSPSFRIFNNGGAAADVLMIVRWQANYGIKEGDIVEIYRGNGINGTINDEPDVDFRLVLSFTLTSVEIAANQVTLYDRQPMTAPLYQTVGRALYCSESQQGATAVNRQPPAARSIGTWGTYSFYGNITDRPQFVLSIPSGLGSTELAAYNTDAFRNYGIGQRTFTANTTNGNATATSVSNTDGIAIGQLFISGSAGFVAGSSTVIAKTASTITFSSNATATATGATFTVVDILEINNQRVWMTGVEGVVGQLGYFTGYEVTPNQTIPVGMNVAVQNFVALIEPIRHQLSTAIRVRATNGQNYAPPLPDINGTVKAIASEQRKNLLRWSKDNQPEHCALGSETFVGQAELICAMGTRDAYWLFCTDGIYVLTGYGGQWNINPIALGVVPVTPRCVTRVGEQVFAYTNKGLVEVKGSGIEPISDGIIDLAKITTAQFEVLGTAFQPSHRVQLSSDEKQRELYLLMIGDSDSNDFSSSLLVYSMRYKAFSTINFPDMGITDITYAKATTVAGESGRPLISLSSGEAAVPQICEWDSVEGATLNPTLLLQPMYATTGGPIDPFVLKRWVDCTWVLDQADGEYELVGTFNDITPYARGPLKSGTEDARITFVVPKRAGLSPTVSPGLRTTTQPGNVLKFRGVKLRYRDITTQESVR